MAVVNTLTTALTEQDAADDLAATNGYPLYVQTGVVEVAAADSDTSTFRVLRLSSKAVLVSLEVACDALGTSADYDIGAYDIAANGGAVIDADEFASAVSMSSAVAWTHVLEEAAPTDKDKLGKPLWERLGYTSDPGKAIDIVATGNTAGDAAGSICMRATYYIK